MDIEVERRGNQWHFSDGTILPVVSGGSDINLPGTGAQENNVTEPNNNPDSLAGDFLKNIPDEDKAIVEKYVKEWDAGVTQKFQGIHDSYKPYKELGDPETIRAAMELRNIMEEDPQYVYNILAQEFGQQSQNPTNSGGQSGSTPLPPEFEGLPQPFVEKWQQQNEMLENLAAVVLGNTEKQRADAEDRALEQTLNELHTKHGEFDEQFVLSKMWAGASGDEAVQAFQNLRQSIIDSQSKPKPQPPGLFGGGGIPNTTPDVTTMSSKDVRGLVAQVLASRNES